MQVKQIKLKKCKCCGNDFQPFRSTQKVCGYPCASILIKREQKQKYAKQQALEHKLMKLKFTAKHKTLSEYEAEAKKAFQRWIRERDKDCNCISCGSPTSKPFWDGGHFKKAELFSGVIFNEENCHKQCRKCNYFLNGNELAYRERLVIKIGAERVEALENLANETRMHKYTRDELIELKKKYSKPYTN